MMATLPLESWRMRTSGLSCGRRFWLLGSRQSVHGDGARLGAAVEADAAAGAVLAGVARRMHAVRAQLRRQLQALGRAGIYAQPAALALLNVNRDFATRCHVHLAAAIAAGRCNHLVRSQYS